MQYYILSILLLTTTVVLAVIYHKKLNIAFKILGIGIILSDIAIMLLILPLLAEPETNKLVSIFSAFQLGTFDADYGVFLAASGGSTLPGIKIYFSILTVLTPLVFGGFLLSFFESTNDAINFSIQKFFCNKYLFSELNKEALELAKSISNADKKALVVFSCDGENPLSPVARTNGFILLNKDLNEIKIQKMKSTAYFEISRDHSKKLSETKAILEKYLAKKMEFL